MKKYMALAVVATLTLVASIPLGAAAQAASDGHGTGHSDTSSAPSHTPDLDQAKDRLEQAIDRRLDRVDRLRERVRSSDALTPGHAAQLTSELSRAQGGLSALLLEVARADTLEGLRSIATEMVEDYRIYLVMTPKTLLAIASDHGVAVSERMSAISARVAEAAQRAAGAGFDVTGVEALVSAADEMIAEGLRLIDPVAETVLPMQPADHPDPAETVLYEAHQSALEARAELREAATLLRDAADLLREVVGAG